MWWFKSCPRCGGDLFERMESDGLALSCIQCGYYLIGAERARLKMGQLATAARPSRKAA